MNLATHFTENIKAVFDIVYQNAEDVAEETLEFLEQKYGDGDGIYEEDEMVEAALGFFLERFPDIPFVNEEAIFEASIEPLIRSAARAANSLMEGLDEEE